MRRYFFSRFDRAVFAPSFVKTTAGKQEIAHFDKLSAGKVLSVFVLRLVRGIISLKNFKSLVVSHKL